MTKKEKEAQRLIVEEIEKATNLLVSTCENWCKETSAKAVPLLLVQSFAETMISSFKKGAYDKEVEK